MPLHKGIGISLVSQWELQTHPEFSHPESSQFTYRSSPGVHQPTTVPGAPARSHPVSTSESKADRLLGRQSLVSVYVPSLSGARFWIKYTVTEQAASHSKFYFFRLLMNGRKISSWGINAQTDPTGQAMNGMFEPSARWNYKIGDVTYKSMGTESRSFFFGNDEEIKSAGSDGGLIEVQVFRANGRQRQMPAPEDFKNQEEYGIVMPSGGLLEQPQDARFYQWLLRDPKDNPFAIFKFHYRSWDSLYSLQLIPADHPRRLIPQSPSKIALNYQSHKLRIQEQDKEYERRSGLISDRGLKRGMELKNDEQRDVRVETGSNSPGNSIQSEISTTPWLTNIFDDVAGYSTPTREQRGLQYGAAALYPDPRKRELPISRFSSSVNGEPSSTPDSEKAQHIWSQIVDRPLPEIPERTSSKKPFGHRQTKSTDSTASGVSITPSLLAELDEDMPSPEPVYGVATAVSIPKMFSKPRLVTTQVFSSPTRKGRTSTAIIEQRTPPAAKDLAQERHAVGAGDSPLAEFFNQPNVANITARRHNRAPGKILPPLSIPSSHSKSNVQDDTILEEEEDDDVPSAISNMTSLSLSPSEWMCRTPSPVRKDPYRRMWSPSPGENKKPRLDGEHEIPYSPTPAEGKKVARKNSHVSIRKKALEWYDHVKQAREEDTTPDTSVLGDDERGRVRSGWI